MFIEFINTEGEPFTVSLLQLATFCPQGHSHTGNTILVMSNGRSVVTSSPYGVVKDRITAMTK